MSLKDYAVKQDKFELLPCPFCGGINLVKEYVLSISGDRIVCLHCGGQMHSMVGIDSAIERWNKRVSKEPTPFPPPFDKLNYEAIRAVVRDELKKAQEERV